MSYRDMVYEMTGERIEGRTFAFSGFVKILYSIYKQNKEILDLLNKNE